jgi:hypothetical protein
MKIPSRILTGAALFAAVLSPSFAQQTANTKPVGYRTELVKAGVFNLLSPNLDNPVGAAGTIDVIAGTTLTDNEANFTAAFTAGDPITLKIVEGTNAGVIQDVVSFTATTITTAQDIANLLAVGNRYQLRKTPTIASTFGAANEAGLLAGTATNADVIWLPDGAAGYNRYFRSTSLTQGQGWRRVGGGTTESAQVPISIADAMFLERRGTTDLSIVFTGHVQTSATKTGVVTGFNPVSRVIPVGVTLAESLLDTELTKGTATSADLIWNPDGNGGYDRYYSSTSAVAGIGWRRVGTNQVDQASVQLKSGYLIERKGAATNVTLRLPSGLDL